MLTGKEIVSIIRAGNQAKVASLEVDGLKVTYQGTTEAPVDIYYHDQNSTSESHHNPPDPQEPTFDELAFTDPVGYEERAIRNETE